VKSVVLVLLALAVIGIAPLFGALPPGEARDFVLFELRLPRVAMGALVGAALGLAGASFQSLFRNPLATPSTLGTEAGAALGALAAFVIGGGAVGAWGVTLSAFAGALIASTLTSAAAASGRLRDADVLLAGVAVTLAAGAIGAGLTATSELRSLVAAAQWSLGHLPQVGWEGVTAITPLVALSIALQLALVRPLASMALGEELAAAQGVAVPRIRALLLGVGAAVAWCGPIAFVGLLVPNAVRLGVGANVRRVLPLAALAGAAFLVACDTLVRVAGGVREIPVGVATAALGAPGLVYLIWRQRPQS
jgi:iron complex transport system permease protein